jgi:hypothetical protein
MISVSTLCFLGLFSDTETDLSMAVHGRGLAREAPREFRSDLPQTFFSGTFMKGRCTTFHA